MKAILLIEDEVEVGRVVEMGLENTLQLQVEVRGTLKEGISYIHVVDNIAAIVTDLCLPDSRGIDTIKKLVEAAPGIPIIVLTGAGDGITYQQAILAGAHDYLEKGNFSFPELARCVLHAIERHRVRKMFTPIEETLVAAQKKVQELRTLVDNS